MSKCLYEICIFFSTWVWHPPSPPRSILNNVKKLQDLIVKRYILYLQTTTFCKRRRLFLYFCISVFCNWMKMKEKRLLLTCSQALSVREGGSQGILLCSAQRFISNCIQLNKIQLINPQNKKAHYSKRFQNPLSCS